jgi:hypothetical protein
MKTLKVRVSICDRNVLKSPKLRICACKYLPCRRSIEVQTFIELEVFIYLLRPTRRLTSIAN